MTRPVPAPVRIAFYVEPVVFRADPHMLAPWLSWLARLVHAQDGRECRFAFMSSPWLCRRFHEAASGVPSFPVLPADILRPFGMDRVRYAQDLAAPLGALAGTPGGNAPLAAALDAMVETFAPDVILSFTENRYLLAYAGRLCTVFTELRPLQRTFRPGFFLDPSGHQTTSLLVTEAARIRTLDLPPSFAAETRQSLEDGFAHCLQGDPETADMLAWLRREADGAPVAALALQPPDWLTLEGLGDARPPDATLLAWLDRLPPGWRAVATYHPAHALPRELEQVVAEQMPQLLLLPEAWRQGRSEWLVHGVDAVVTNSSTVGWAALLAGKRAVATARCNLRGFAAPDVAALDEAAALTPAERVRLAGFWRHRYSVAGERLLDEPGCAARVLRAIAAGGTEYFFADFPGSQAGARREAGRFLAADASRAA